MGRISHTPDTRPEVISPFRCWAVTSSGVDSGGAEGLPHDGLADVGGNEQRDPRAEAVTFLEQLVQQQDDHAGNKQLRKKNSFSVLGDSSSSHRQPALEEQLTWIMMSRQIPAPISDGSPYMPVITYTMAWPMVMIIPNTEKHQQALRSAVADAFFKPTGVRFTFLGSVEERSVLRRVSDLNDLGSGEQLHDQA